MKVAAAAPAAWPWLVERTGCVLTSDFRAIQATDVNGKIRGMVGYCDWAPNSVRAHLAADSPIVWRSLLRPALEYPFTQAGVGMILAAVRGSNARSLRFCGAVGLGVTCRVKDGFKAGEDWVLLQLRKEDCRFLLGSETHWAPQERRVA